jgi:hypothetical protein
LQIGEKTTVYFLVDASGARRGKPPVEFVLHNLGGDPDPDDAMRHNARTIFIAELDYDPNTGISVVYIPEGKVSLTLKSMAVDPVALQQLCKNVFKPGSGRIEGGRRHYPSGARDGWRQLRPENTT